MSQSLTNEQAAELLTLLQRWAALEPERCKAVNSRDYQRQNFQLDCGEIEPISFCLKALDLIVGAVMRAIAAKGWDYEMSFRNQSRDPQEALTWKVDLLHPHPLGGKGYQMMTASKPVILVLTTYINALECFKPMDGGVS